MSTPFLAEIKLFSFNFAPKGWAFCNGQLLPINQNQALFSLLGTTYGGDGMSTFALPNLQGKVPVHAGSGFTLGQTGGEQNHTLATAEMALHSHTVNASAANANSSGPGVPAAAAHLYGPAATLVSLDPTSLTSQGSGQPHSNMMPSLVVSFCIALQGIFPSRN